jgi:uncharacterized membrane protein YbhN (UPF0104 family)
VHPVSGAASRQRGARALTIALQLGVSLALVVALILVVDWQGLWRAAQALSVAGVVGVAVLNLSAQASLVWRWRALLATVGVREPFRSSWRTVFAGLFLNNFMPGTLGSDGLRILLMARACGSAPVAIGAIAYERAIQFAIYAILIMLASLWPMAWLAPWLHLLVVAVGGFGLLALLALLKWLSGRKISPAPAGASLWVRGWSLLGAMLAETGHMQVRMRRHRRAQLLFAGSSLVNVVFVFGIFVVALHDLGRPVDLPVIVFAVGIASIASGLPVSFGGIGVYEAALVVFLGMGGVPSGDALLVALVVRASSILVSLVGLPSALLLWGERRRGG